MLISAAREEANGKESLRNLEKEEEEKLRAERRVGASMAAILPSPRPLWDEQEGRHGGRRRLSQGSQGNGGADYL